MTTLNWVHAGSGPRVVLLHGFTQTFASWTPVAERLHERYELIAVDAPGHGGSPLPSGGVEQAAAMLGEVAGRRAAYVGYSMGGRICLRLAIDRPDLVQALVLISASAGLADPAARVERQAADEALADNIERAGVELFIDQWLAQPMFATLPESAAGRAERLANTPEGLAAALRWLGPGTQEPLHERLAEVRAPTLLLAGGLDVKFWPLAQQIAERIGPHAHAVVIPGAGHAVHLERPAKVATRIDRFLTERLQLEPRTPARSEPHDSRSSGAGGTPS